MDLSRLNPDLFIQHITYIPFEEVITLCTSNRTLHSYCTDPRYNAKWKMLIDTTFGGIYNYSEILSQVQQDVASLNPENPSGMYPNTLYNYLVYTQLVKKLDPLTQLIIYYKQGDMKSFDKFPRYQQFLALFLLNKRDIIMDYFPDTADQEEKERYLGYIELVDKKPVSQRILNSITFEMIRNGNLKGVMMMERLGGDILLILIKGLRQAAMNGYLEIVKYLVEKGPHFRRAQSAPLILAARNGHLNVVKFLVEKGADVHARQGQALKEASKNGHAEIVRYLLSIGSYPLDTLNMAYVNAYDNEHFTTAEIISNKHKEQEEQNN